MQPNSNWIDQSKKCKTLFCPRLLAFELVQEVNIFRYKLNFALYSEC